MTDNVSQRMSSNAGLCVQMQDGQSLESRSRAKRPRELPVTNSNQPHGPGPKIAQQYVSSSFPQLPEDLYNSGLQPDQYGGASRKLPRFISHDHSAAATMGFENCLQPNVQQNAARAAFRPEIAAFRPEITSFAAHEQGSALSGHPQTACADQNTFPSHADVSLFSAALSVRVQHVHAQQQLTHEVELPFPGMHTLDLSFPLAQPACYEAAQQLTERPGDFQAALTRCPLSQVQAVLHSMHMNG